MIEIDRYNNNLKVIDSLDYLTEGQREMVKVWYRLGYLNGLQDVKDKIKTEVKK